MHNNKISNKINNKINVYYMIKQNLQKILKIKPLKYGQMAINMKESYLIIKDKGKACFFGSMEINLKEIGKMIREMDKGNYF